MITYNITNEIDNDWVRGKVIQVQNSIVFCLCHFGKVKFIGNNILKYLSDSLKNSRLINQHIFFSFKIDTFLQWQSDPNPLAYIGTF